jgi:glycosyltransferase involved in cell wall biosynthesis
MDKQNDILVSICSLTYNHALYIRQCLDGLLMQKTNFKYEIIIHDDCSTDGTADIVREYAENYPDIIVPILQSVNQYQNGNPHIWTSFFYPKVRGKYIALCEGDDYWIDPMKLQKQVDYLDTHPDCSMTCSRAKWFSQYRNKYVAEQYCLKTDGLLNPVDIINRTGLYIPTCSIVYRLQIRNNYPDYCENCPVGDWPLQILAAMKGSVYYFDEAMCVYRVESDGSWTSKQKFYSVDPARLQTIYGQVKMFEGLSKDYPEFKTVFNDKIAEFVCKNIPRWVYGKKELDVYRKLFLDEINMLPFKWKIFYRICLLRVPLVKYWYRKIFLRRFFLKMDVFIKGTIRY